MSKRVVVRRSMDYGSDRKASSYLIEGENGWRFAKCSKYEAAELTPEKAKKVLSNVKRSDPHKDNATYDLITI